MHGPRTSLSWFQGKNPSQKTAYTRRRAETPRRLRRTFLAETALRARGARSPGVPLLSIRPLPRTRLSRLLPRGAVRDGDCPRGERGWNMAGVWWADTNRMPRIGRGAGSPKRRACVLAVQLVSTGAGSRARTLAVTARLHGTHRKGDLGLSSRHAIRTAVPVALVIRGTSGGAKGWKSTALPSIVGIPYAAGSSTAQRARSEFTRARHITTYHGSFWLYIFRRMRNIDTMRIY